MSDADRAAFIERFGGVYEHSPWVAETAYDHGARAEDGLALSSAFSAAFAWAAPERRLAVLRAHPDLAGKLAAAKRLTVDSTAEQASAGLDALTDAERARFAALNDAYTARFGHPFIIAVRDHDKASILTAFERRIAQDAETEFAEACRQVDRIAALRIAEIVT